MRTVRFSVSVFTTATSADTSNCAATTFVAVAAPSAIAPSCPTLPTAVTAAVATTAILPSCGRPQCVPLYHNVESTRA